MIPDNPDRGETDHTASDPLAANADLFRIETARISPFGYLSIAVPGDALRDGPYPRAARPRSGRAGMSCALDPRRSQIAAVGEAVELASSCAWGDEPLIRARAADLGPPAIRTGAILGFSAAQVRDRDAWNHRYGRYDWRPPVIAHSDLADWIPAEDATTGQMRFVAADAVLIGRGEPGDDGAVAIADSNGCAAGATAGAAQAAALLELIERDATGRWWYGRRRRPALPLSILPDVPGLADWLARRDRRTWLLDITTDLGIPVVAALSRDASGGAPALGFAARTTLADAALAAFCELQGVETSLPPWRDASGDRQMAEWLDLGPAALPPLGPVQAPATGTPPGDPLETCLTALARRGLCTCFIDLTRPMFGVPVFRAVVPGLCHCKPRFGPPRLLAADPLDLPPAADAVPNAVPLLI